jgi:hypothetical protein
MTNSLGKNIQNDYTRPINLSTSKRPKTKERRMYKYAVQS